eukprot:GILK01002703.1.p1 GENE.GILK01002703.1~~GILK01002703.1.p1  ORF type:complete len:508 (-),score=34.16 GILK01002703.1:310-1677(-)
MSEVSFVTCFLTMILFFNNLVRNTLDVVVPSLMRYQFVVFLVDFALVVVPILISFTFTEWTSMMLLFMLFSSVFLNFFYKRVSPTGCSLITLPWDRKGSFKKKSLRSSGDLVHLEIFSQLRSTLMLATCIAILAVDFDIFPRRFAKTEEYGTSLMDAGVGSVIFSSALVSRQARDFSHSSSASSEKSSEKATLWSVLRSTSPMLLIGALRLFMVKSTQYQEHVTEYGTHWNFFFTIGFVSFFSVIVNPRPSAAAAWGVAIAVVYQLVLSGGLESYIMSDTPRVDFFSSNREGLCSAFGYLSIHFIGISCGHCLLRVHRQRTKKDPYTLLFALLLASSTLWAATLVSQAYIGPVSRRLINLPYILWILAYNLSSLASLVVFDLCLTNHRDNVVISSVNFNQLVVFILSNLLTGWVNVTINTLEVPAFMAFGILLSYMFVVCLGAYLLYHLQLRIKL